MSEDTVKDKLANLFEDLKEYINVKFQILTLSLGEKVAKVLAAISSSVAIIILLSLFIFFASFAAAFAIGGCIGGYGYGFLIVAGFYLLLGVIIFIFKSRVEKPLINIFIKMFFGQNDDDEDE